MLCEAALSPIIEGKVAYKQDKKPFWRFWNYVPIYNIFTAVHKNVPTEALETRDIFKLKKN